MYLLEMSGSLEPVTQPDPTPSDKPPAKKSAAAQVIGGVPGTVIAFVTALTGAISAYTNYQEQQAISKATYEALKQATDRNTEQLVALSHEMKRNQEWTRSVAAAVRELQTKAPVTKKQAPPLVLPPAPLDEPPPPAAPTLPSFDQLKKE